jgi:voltage-gated sodium channel
MKLLDDGTWVAERILGWDLSMSNEIAHVHVRARIAAFVESRAVQRAIVTLIVLNAITLGLETYVEVMAQAGALLNALDTIFLSIFVVEIVMRIIAHGPRFFRDPWSVFDFVVVGIALVPAAEELTVLRALRILRALRLLTVIPQMRRVVGALLAAVPGLSSIAVILLLLYYVFAVVATNLYGERFPEWFGSLGKSMFTLFQVMTLEGWAEIAKQVGEVHPWSWIFFVVYILVTTFTMLNLFIAIIVSTMESEHEAEQQQVVSAVIHATDQVTAAIHADVQAVRADLNELKASLEREQARSE